MYYTYTLVGEGIAKRVIVDSDLHGYHSKKEPKK